MIDVIERAARGAALLDEVNPGWHGRINLETLDVKYDTRCVLTQLYGNYGEGLGRLDLDLAVSRASYGFTILADDATLDERENVLWPALTRAWQDEVLRRRET